MEKMHLLSNDQAYQQKTEKINVSEEKKFGRIDSWGRLTGLGAKVEMFGKILAH